jgi:hypothetical protein
VVNNDDSMLNNHPTLELIDIDGISSNTLDDYSTHKDVSVIHILILRKKNTRIDRMNINA